MRPILADKESKENIELGDTDQIISKVNVVSNKTQESSSAEGDIKTKLAKLETERVEMARQEIQAILDKYGVRLQGVVMLPANQIQIVPER